MQCACTFELYNPKGYAHFWKAADVFFAYQIDFEEKSYLYIEKVACTQCTIRYIKKLACTALCTLIYGQTKVI